MSILRRNARRVLLDKVNMTLTEIVDADKGIKRNRGRARKRASSEPPSSSRLLLSNLEEGFTDQDLEELLEAVGKLKLVRLHYDDKGRSVGSAEIEFVADSDAKKAVEKYDGVTLDGLLPLRFEYLISKPTSKRIKNDMKNALDPTGVYGKENAARAHSKENYGCHDRGGKKASPEEKQIDPNPKGTSSGTMRRTPKKRGASAGAGTWSDEKKPKRIEI